MARVRTLHPHSNMGGNHGKDAEYDIRDGSADALVQVGWVEIVKDKAEAKADGKK